jgi:CBS domain-containing protein
MTTETTPLVTYIRQIPFVEPWDSLYRAAELLRFGNVDTLPVIDGYGNLYGVITLRELLPLLEAEQGEESLQETVSTRMRQPGAVGYAGMELEEARRALVSSGETTLALLDSQNRYIGAVTLADMLVPNVTPPRPTGVGGMATPWGVYLTNGYLQAGSGNLSLVAGGVVMGLLMIGAHLSVGAVSWLMQQLFSYPLYALWSAPPPAQITPETIGWYLLQGIALPLFLAMIRLMPLAGYHAAEHQAVHALERGEPLRPEIVKRMPRVHPRCGTNLLAGGLVFALISQIVPALNLWGLNATDGAILGAVAALFTWRSLGAVLQQYITTRPATERQIASGILAAMELQQKFLQTIPQRPTLLRRLWCMGLPQTLVGVSIGSSAALSVAQLLMNNLR